MGETGEMKTLLSDAPETRVNAHWVVSGCTSLLNVYLKMCIFSFVSGLFSCSLLALHMPHPPPPEPTGIPLLPLGC